MMMMSKKIFKFITNDERRLDLSKLGLNPNDVIILNIKKSIYQLLEDNNDIDLIKQSGTSGKTVYVIVGEMFPSEMGGIDKLEDVKNKHKKIKKIFKKYPNVFFFFGNISDDEKIYGVEDGNITISDPDFFNQLEENEKRLKEERALLEADRLLEEESLSAKRKELTEEELSEEERKLNFDIQNEGLNLTKIQDSNNISENIEEDITTNDFDQEFAELNKLENSAIEYPIIDFKEYSLKSIYDFIWRMLILSNDKLLLNDLIYLSVNNFSSLSSGQNEFIRELSNNVDSLFDMVLKLDYKLEFNNKLFYTYLSNLFTIINGICRVNREFLFDLSIWSSDEARENFVSRTESFMNNNLVSLEKIIYSHFVEFSTLIQGSIPRLKGSLTSQDIHLVLYKKVQHLRSKNMFSIISKNLFRSSKEVGLELDSIILDEDAISNLDSKLKVDMSNAYNIFLEELKNFILLKGSDEANVSKLYNILMSIGIESIIDERVEIIKVSDLVNKDQVEKEDSYYHKQMNDISKNEIVNIKYEDIEALYKESVNFQNKSNINDEIHKFDLDSIRGDFNYNFKDKKDYGLKNELDFESIDKLGKNIDMSSKIDDFESKIRANIELIEKQRSLLKEKTKKYSINNSNNEIIRMK